MLHQFAAEFDISGEMNLFDSFGIEATQQRLQELIAVGEVLAQKYEVVVTNPPYMGSSGMGAKLSAYVKQNYPDSKSDLFAVFIEKGNNMVCANGYNCMVTMQSWMFLSSFEKMRKNILQTKIISNLMHMENMVLGIAFGTAVSNFRNCMIKGYKGTYNQIKLSDIVNSEPAYFPVKENRFAQVSSDNFAKIPGSPVAYWLSNRIYDIFNNKDSDMKKYCLGEGKNVTTNNAKYILNIWEVAEYKVGAFNLKWLPCAMGGEYRKWYGNIVNVIDWSIEAQSFYRKNKAGRIIRKEFWNMFGVTWGKISSGRSSFRFLNFNQMYQETAILQKSKRDTLCALAILNSKISSLFLDSKLQ